MHCKLTLFSPLIKLRFLIIKHTPQAFKTHLGSKMVKLSSAHDQKVLAFIMIWASSRNGTVAALRTANCRSRKALIFSMFFVARHRRNTSRKQVRQHKCLQNHKNKRFFAVLFSTKSPPRRIPNSCAANWLGILPGVKIEEKSKSTKLTAGDVKCIINGPLFRP